MSKSGKLSLSKKRKAKKEEDGTTDGTTRTFNAPDSTTQKKKTLLEQLNRRQDFNPREYSKTLAELASYPHKPDELKRAITAIYKFHQRTANLGLRSAIHRPLHKNIDQFFQNAQDIESITPMGAFEIFANLTYMNIRLPEGLEAQFLEKIDSAIPDSEYNVINIDFLRALYISANVSEQNINQKRALLDKFQGEIQSVRNDLELIQDGGSFETAGCDYKMTIDEVSNKKIAIAKPELKRHINYSAQEPNSPDTLSIECAAINQMLVEKDPNLYLLVITRKMEGEKMSPQTVNTILGEIKKRPPGIYTVRIDDQGTPLIHEAPPAFIKTVTLLENHPANENDGQSPAPSQ